MDCSGLVVKTPQGGIYGDSGTTSGPRHLSFHVSLRPTAGAHLVLHSCMESLEMSSFAELCKNSPLFHGRFLAFFPTGNLEEVVFLSFVKEVFEDIVLLSSVI